MCLQDLSKAITFCNIGNVFKTLPSETIALLENKLEEYFNSQSLLNDTGDALVADLSNTSFKESLEEAEERREDVISALEDVILEAIDTLTSYARVEEEDL